MEKLKLQLWVQVSEIRRPSGCEEVTISLAAQKSALKGADAKPIQLSNHRPTNTSDQMIRSLEVQFKKKGVLTQTCNIQDRTIAFAVGKEKIIFRFIKGTQGHSHTLTLSQQ